MNALRVLPEALAAWHAEHLEFLRRLDLLERELAAFHEGRRPDYEAMIEVLRAFADETAAAHHAREDAAYALLAAKEPAMQLAYARLQQEHRVIAHAGRELLELLESALDGAVLRRERVEAAAATYLVYYRSHIAVEEQEALPRAAQALSLDDWAMVAASGTPAPGSSSAPAPRA